MQPAKLWRAWKDSMTALGPAPLLSLPGAAFPPGVAAVYCPVSGGAALRALLIPAADPIGSVVVSPGRTEPIEKYVEVVGDLVARGFTVLVHDWRGQGASGRLLPDPLRGHADGFEVFIDDYRLLLDQFAADLPTPRLSLGHSMGACLVLAALARGEARLAGAVLSSPMLSIKTGTPGWLARLVAAAMCGLGQAGAYAPGGPTDPLADRFGPDRLTHDRARSDRTRAQLLTRPELALGYVTWGWLNSALSISAWLGAAKAVERIAIPVTLVAAGEDRLVGDPAIRRMAARLSRGRYVQIPGAYHELLMETDAVRARFWAAFDELAGSIAPRG
jgi:lysophospholipase